MNTKILAVGLLALLAAACSKGPGYDEQFLKDLVAERNRVSKGKPKTESETLQKLTMESQVLNGTINQSMWADCKKLRFLYQGVTLDCTRVEGVK